MQLTANLTANLTTNLVTTKQAAALLGVSVNTFRSYQSRHQIHATPETRGTKRGRGYESLFVHDDVVRLKADLDARRANRAANQSVTHGKKRCGKCGQRLPVAQFHACSVARCGLSTWCRNCTSQTNRAYFHTTVTGDKRAARAQHKRERNQILQAIADGKERHPAGFFLVKVETTGLFFARALDDANRRCGKIVAQLQPVEPSVDVLGENWENTPVAERPWAVYCAEQWGVAAAHTAAWLLKREQRIYRRAGGRGNG